MAVIEARTFLGVPPEALSAFCALRPLERAGPLDVVGVVREFRASWKTLEATAESGFYRLNSQGDLIRVVLADLSVGIAPKAALAYAHLMQSSFFKTLAGLFAERLMARTASPEPRRIALTALGEVLVFSDITRPLSLAETQAPERLLGRFDVLLPNGLSAHSLLPLLERARRFIQTTADVLFERTGQDVVASTFPDLRVLPPRARGQS